MRPFLEEAVNALPDWWERFDSDPAWRKYSEYGLAAGYGLIALVALSSWCAVYVLHCPRRGYLPYQGCSHAGRFLVNPRLVGVAELPPGDANLMASDPPTRRASARRKVLT